MRAGQREASATERELAARPDELARPGELAWPGELAKPGGRTSGATFGTSAAWLAETLTCAGCPARALALDLDPHHLGDGDAHHLARL